jgi:hypothetical protein
MTIISLSLILLFLIPTPPALAYVGPGLGLGTIGAILGVVLSAVLAIFAVVWYPIKRWLGIGKRNQ